jgi:2-polyprenyl-3-methyl-5-hydroxy-6-metoxy-1,4-benzoquinol methylase
MSTELETLDSCNLCGGTAFHTVTEMRGRVTPHTFRIVRCAGCGLVFTNPRLTEEANARMYDEAYYQGKGFDPSVHYEGLAEEAEARAGESAGIVAKIRALAAAPNPRILDVGCGTGVLLHALREAGFAHVEGQEYSSYAAARAQERSGCRVHAMTLEELAATGARYDAINATEVIEHVRDPRQFLASIAQLLAPGGVFVYSTGNARGLYARVLGTRWPYLNPEGHLFYYDPSTLRRYLHAAGLTPLGPDDVDAATRRRLRKAEAAIAHSQLLFIGQSAPGLKGFVFRTAAIASHDVAKHVVSWVVGKGQLPSGRKPVAA